MSERDTDQRTGALFGYPSIGRAGLGNELFAWARCFLWCRENHAAMLAPQWLQLHLGPYLRFERDKRAYHRLFRADGYIGGIRRAQILLGARVIAEAEWQSAAPAGRPLVVRFDGMDSYFAPLLGQHAEIHQELARITKPQFLPKNLPAAPFIGVHIRLGDFRAPADEKELASGAWNVRIDLAWFAHAITAARHALGEPAAPVMVFSDGAEGELEPVLALPGVVLYRAGSAIGDLLALSSARIVIASGSSFSAWASFLSQSPTIWFPGQRRAGLIVSDPDLAAEPELAQGAGLSVSFQEIARAAWAGAVK